MVHPVVRRAPLAGPAEPGIERPPDLLDRPDQRRHMALRRSLTDLHEVGVLGRAQHLEVVLVDRRYAVGDHPEVPRPAELAQQPEELRARGPGDILGGFGVQHDLVSVHVSKLMETSDKTRAGRTVIAWSA
jgi:hypothetical protein